jgi:hypothetical protein
MPHLLELPNEIILEVISVIVPPPRDDGSGADCLLESLGTDLYRRSRSCRTLRNLTKPLLYTKYVEKDKPKTIRQISTNDLGEAPSRCQGQKHVLEQDIDMLRHDSDIGAAVLLQELAIITRACQAFNLADVQNCGLPCVTGLLYDEWLDTSSAQRFQDLAALAIFLLPNLEIIYLDPISPLDSGLFIRHLHEVTIPNGLMMKVQSIVYLDRTQVGIPVEILDMFFSLPELRLLNIHRLQAHFVELSTAIPSNLQYL